jgi:hypothetical protein
MNGDVNPDGTEQELEGPTTENGTPPLRVPADDAPPKPHFHNIDLDKMHRRLYRGRYLTPDDLLTDLARIVNNAELAGAVAGEIEQEQRAQAMLNHARVMVDQACDVQFRLECARMAEREGERMRKEDAEKKEKDGETTEAPPAPSTPLRRVDGGAGEMELDDAGGAERQLKRQRTASAPGSRSRTPVEHDMHEPHPKRARNDLEENGERPMDGEGDDLRDRPAAAGDRLTEADILATDGDFEAGVSSNVIMEGVEGADHRLEHVPGGTDMSFPTHPEMTVPSSPIRNGNHAPVETNGIHSDPFVSNSAQPVAPDALPTPPPEPRPRFIIDDHAVELLAMFLRVKTSDLNVEELEQLRAACFDVVWRARREWNREALVGELQELAAGFVEEATASRRA